MKNPKLRTLFKQKLEYPEYIYNDRDAIDKVNVLLNLNELQSVFFRNGVVDSSYSEPNTFLTTKYDMDWAFECYKMKRAILFNRKHIFNNSIYPYLTNQANQVLLLAMVYGNIEIVSYFLTNRLININQSIFGSIKWPSYFILACTCSTEILNIFKNYKIKYYIGWNGLTPHLISAFRDFRCDKTSYLDFIPYKEYKLLLKYRKIHLAESLEPLPIFVLDFACMNKNRNLIKDILEEIPEAGNLSKLSFILQSEENLFLILSRYEFRNNQHFNGNTPLHFCCYTGDLCAISLLMYLGFPILPNFENKFPNELGNLKIREKASLLVDLATTGIDNGTDTNKVFLYSNFQDKMDEIFAILKLNPKNYDKYVGIFRYLKFNKNNKIISNSRFNIINLLTMSKTPASVEQAVSKMNKIVFYEKDYHMVEAIGLYYKVFKYNY